jgi:hypothetical protein
LRRQRALGWILSLAGLSAFVLTVLAALTGELRLALLFPWRVSAWLVPASTALVLGAVFDHWLRRPRTSTKLLLGVATACLMGAAVRGVILDVQAWRETSPEAALVTALRANTAVDDVLVAPLDMEWVRLEAERAVVADTKSHPFQANEVVEWWSRVQLVTTLYDVTRSLPVRTDALAHVLAIEPHAAWLLLPAQDPLVVATHLPVVWRDAKWALLTASSSAPRERASR